VGEYSFYEFAALDRPLTSEQQVELRTISSRAVITAFGFTNTYHYGGLKAEPSELLARYFDALVHSTESNHCWLALRFPKDIIASAVLETYCPKATSTASTFSPPAFDIHDEDPHCFLHWTYRAHDIELPRFIEQNDGPGWLARLLALRDEIIQGDHRPLYLGWLACVSAGEIAHNALEPPLPAGLRDLTLAQQALVDFLMLDPDMLASAAATSTDIAVAPVNAIDQEQEWMSALGQSDVRHLLGLLVQRRGREAQHFVDHSLSAWMAERSPRPGAAAAKPRSVATIVAGIERQKTLRLEREAVTRQERDKHVAAKRRVLLDQLLLRAD